MAGERLRLAAGINVQHIPFRGPVEAFTEVMTGRVDFYYLPIAPALPNIGDGKVVALAVSTPKRAPTLPNVPTVVEAGYPDARLSVLGRAGGAGEERRAPSSTSCTTKPRRRSRCRPFRRDLATLGVEPKPMSVDEFDKFFRDDVAATVKLGKDAHIVPTN